MNILKSFLDVIIPSNDDMPSGKDIDLNLDNILKENQKYIKPTKEIISFMEREPASRVMGGVLSLKTDNSLNQLWLFARFGCILANSFRVVFDVPEIGE